MRVRASADRHVSVHDHQLRLEQRSQRTAAAAVAEVGGEEEEEEEEGRDEHREFMIEKAVG